MPHRIRWHRLRWERGRGTVSPGLPSWDARNGLWDSAGQGADSSWGTWGDIPTPGDFNGDGSDDLGVFRPSTGAWLVSCSSVTNCPGGTLTVPWGTAGDLPVPADYDDDGTTDYGVWRPGNGSWWVRNGASGATLVAGVAWGQFGDCPIASRLRGVNGPGPMQLNVWRPSSGVWYYGRSFEGTGGLTFEFGTYGDIPFGADMDGDDDGDFVVFRPSTGTWYGESPDFAIAWGQPGDIPVARSDLLTQIEALIIYRPTTGLIYKCFVPVGSSCLFGTATEGPSGSPGVVPLQDRWK